MPARVVRAVGRRVWPDRTPRTAGVRFTRVRPETVGPAEPDDWETAGKIRKDPRNPGNQPRRSNKRREQKKQDSLGWRPLPVSSMSIHVCF